VHLRGGETPPLLSTRRRAGFSGPLKAADFPQLSCKVVAAPEPTDPFSYLQARVILVPALASRRHSWRLALMALNARILTETAYRLARKPDDSLQPAAWILTLQSVTNFNAGELAVREIVARHAAANDP
jgi:hypothetical protein